MTTTTAQLHPLSPAPLPFAPALHVRGFLVPREHENLLVYSSPALAGDAGAIRDLGGASHQYLNHWHEAMFGDDSIRDDLGARLVVHAADRDQASAYRTVDATFSERGTLGGGFELIPVPGHTPGATAFLWDSGERRYLFTGDTIYLDHGEWVAAVLDSSDRGAYLASLALIRDLEFDVLVPWGSTAGMPWCAETDRDDARRRIDAIVERVRRGEAR
jgi:glyoxylase-like metal-dependent hydrolase (beta-lactamase superfamily II)